MSLPKIYVWCVPHGQDWVGFAVAEDGDELAAHISSSPEWSRHDMDRPYKHEAYRKHYPDGYEIVHEPWPDEVRARNHEKYPAERIAH